MRRSGVRLFGIVVLMAAVASTTQAQAQRPPSVAQARQQVEQLQNQAEIATERYNAVREQQAALQVRLGAAQVKQRLQLALVEKARKEVGAVAADLYKAGDLSTLSLFLGDDPERALAADGLQSTLATRRSAAVSTLLAEQKALVAGVQDVTAQRNRLAETALTLRDAKTAITDKLAQANAVLARLTTQQRAELARLNQVSSTVSLKEAGVKPPPSGMVGCKDISIEAPTPQVAKVLSYACAQLGDPYLWGGDGPNTFDCSGLTMRAWEQAGVSLPHNAAMQAGYGTRISASQLRPGDLVFFHTPIGHNAIYLGHGLMLHAPHSGDVVRIAPMRYAEMVAAVRL